MDQPLRAWRCTERIRDWRRGAGYADLACYYVEHGGTAEIKGFLAIAKQVADDPTVEDWRKDRIRVKMAKTHVLLGHPDQAEVLAQGVEPSETGKLAGVKAQVSGEGDFEEQIKGFEGLLATKKFDIMRNAQESALALYRRCYKDASRRGRVEEMIRRSWVKMPQFIPVDLQLKMAEVALEQGDPTKALELVNAAGQMTDGTSWRVDYHIPLLARLAELCARAGDGARARARMEAALALYEKEKKQILDIDRAGTLCPLAVTWVAMGDKAQALRIYRQAVVEGAVNPNSRPRALDLSATCLSMCQQGVEPDAELWAKLRQTRKGLGDPW